MKQDAKKEQGILEISPEREQKIWEHFLGLYTDRFVKNDQTIDVVAFRECLEKKLGSLFTEHAEQFEAIIQKLNHTVDSTRAGLLLLLVEPIRQLREESHSDYPSFEARLRVLNQEQNDFTPLTSNRMVSYQVDGEYVYLHIQPSYSVADKSGTMEEAMRALAKILVNPAFSGVKKVAIDSWLVTDRPARWEQLGFGIDPDRDGFARVSVQEFRKRWL